MLATTCPWSVANQGSVDFSGTNPDGVNCFTASTSMLASSPNFRGLAAASARAHTANPNAALTPLTDDYIAETLVAAVGIGCSTDGAARWPYSSVPACLRVTPPLPLRARHLCSATVTNSGAAEVTVYYTARLTC